MRARLIPSDGSPPVDLTKDLTLFGRDEDCDIRLELKGVSKLHCVVVKTDGLLLVRDLGSTNGTRVNGTRIRRAALLPNDNISIANMLYQVKFGVELEGLPPLPEAAPVPSLDIPEKKAPLRVNTHPDIYPDLRTPRS